MKYTTSFKLRLKVVTALMSLTCLVHAGSGNLQLTYQQMSGVLKTMEQQANDGNLSNTYSGKLFNNIDSLKNDLTQATSLSRGAQSSGGSGLSILIELAADAADTGAIHNFSADAKQNIAIELDNSIDSLTDKEKIEDVNDVLNVLMGGASVMATPAARLSNAHTGVESSIAPRRNRNFQFRKQPRAQTSSPAQATSRVATGLLMASEDPAPVTHTPASASLRDRLASVQSGRHTDSSRTLSGATMIMAPSQAKPKSSFFSTSLGITKRETPQAASTATPRPSSPPVIATPLTSGSLRKDGRSFIDTGLTPVQLPLIARKGVSKNLSKHPTKAPSYASEDPQSVIVGASSTAASDASSTIPAVSAVPAQKVPPSAPPRETKPRTLNSLFPMTDSTVPAVSGFSASAEASDASSTIPAVSALPAQKIPPPPPPRGAKPRILNSLFPMADSMVSASAGSGTTTDGGVSGATAPK